MTYIALLRAVNLGGRSMVAMSALRDLVASLGFDEVRTLLQSGNVVFRGSRRATARLERALEQALSEQLGVTTSCLVRTAAEWHAMVAANPFTREAEREPHRLLITALRDVPTCAAVRALQSAIAGGARVEVVGRHAYAVYSEGVGRSKLTNALIEKKLSTIATGRNWNTVMKLAALAGDS